MGRTPPKGLACDSSDSTGVSGHSFLPPSKVFSRSAKIGISIALVPVCSSRHFQNVPAGGIESIGVFSKAVIFLTKEAWRFYLGSLNMLT